MRQTITAFITDALRTNNPNGFFRDPLVGFSSASDPSYASLKTIIGDHHLLPRDILPEGKTVISFFVPFARFVSRGNRTGEVSREWALAYIECNAFINSVAKDLIDFLAARSILAATVKSTHNFDTVTFQTAWSHKSAARISGIGTFGRNRLLITPRGCAGRCGTVITSEELQPDKIRRKELCLFYTTGKCSHCIDKCPEKALGNDAIDRTACYARLMATDSMYPEYETCDVCGKCSTGPCAYYE